MSQIAWRLELACPRGAAAPDTHTQRRLFAASGGYCQNPNCARELFVDADGKSIHIAEMAHVFAASNDGPRANSGLSQAHRGAFDNLIMLCAICHTIVDKAPEAYPDTMMLAWKRSHAQKLATMFGAVEYERRETARRVIAPLLAQNRAIFDRYGPHIDAAEDPESGASERWRRKMLTHILPNSNKLLAILDANRRLLGADELLALEAFRQHIDDLEAFHIEGLNEDASRFPAAMAGILED